MTTTIKKGMPLATFTAIIEAIQLQSELDRKMNLLQKQYNSDNYLISLISDDILNALKLVLIDAFGTDGYDWIEWWLYEAVDKTIYYSDGEEICVEEISSLWKYINTNLDT